MSYLKLTTLGALMGLTVAVVIAGLASANQTATIDFEGLTEGAIVNSVSSGAGISRDVVAGFIAVTGLNPAFLGLNAARIFDAECQGGCTGGDNDLHFPGHGNVLIINDDPATADPDPDPGDADLPGAFFTFDFSGFGPGIVRVDSIDVGDVEFAEGEGGASIQLYSGGPAGTLLATVPIPNTGNNVILTILAGVSGVDYMRVKLNGSGAIDNIRITLDGEQAPGNARVTGGGHQVLLWGANGERVRVTRGFTLHCDILLSNNLEINWAGGNNWHIDKPLEEAVCFDDPGHSPNPPAAPADTIIAWAFGSLNGAEPSVACIQFEDWGEPGSNDKALIHIFNVGFDPLINLSGADPCQAAGGPGANTALLVPLSNITGGNIQFHEDQPHK